MNFFEHQRKAKSKTKILIFYFSLAILGLMTATHFITVAILDHAVFNGQNDSSSAFVSYTNPQIMVFTLGGTLLLIFVASLFKTYMLSSGGKSVCLSMGARQIFHDTKDFDEKKFFNVVEEMSIASGVPIPSIFIMEDSAINAFAAGHSIKDAAICVTRGSIENLTRDELQAVVAHEFGHIFNGDMKLNIKLIGLIFGILFLSRTGELLWRSSTRSSRRSSSKKDGGGGQIALLGLALWLLGMLGALFASIIKAAISREREYLADATAVQFTRNGVAMCSVLKKILSVSDLQTFKRSELKEVSHMFFTSGFKSWFATHPPLPERIKRIDKRFNYNLFLKDEAKFLRGKIDQKAYSFKNRTSEFVSSFERQSTPLSVQKLMQDIGSVSDQSIQTSQALLKQIPEFILEGVYNSFSAQGIVCAYLLQDDASTKENQLAIIQDHFDLLAKEALRYEAQLKCLDQKLRLPIIELAIGQLHNLPKSTLRDLNVLLIKLVKADKKVSLFELLVVTLLKEHEKSQAGRKERVRAKKMANEIPLVMSLLCYVSYPQAQDAAQLHFSEAMKKMKVTNFAMVSSEKFAISALRDALAALDQLTQNDKELFMQCCVDIIVADDHISYREQELLRLIASSLTVPMPLLY